MAKTFLAEGAKVAICDVDKGRLGAFAVAHPEAIAVQADVANEAAIRGLEVVQVRETYVQGVSLRTWVDPEEIAAMAVYLSNPSGRTISGQALSIDGHTESLSV